MNVTQLGLFSINTLETTTITLKTLKPYSSFKWSDVSVIAKSILVLATSFQFVIFKPLSYCFEEIIGFDVKVSCRI